MNKRERLALVLRTVLLLAVFNAVMSAAQICIGFVSYSDALVADGMHTLLDLIMDGVTYFACQFASRPPDKYHAYGYKRVETLACLILSILLCAIGIGVMYEAICVRNLHPVRSDYVIYVSIFTMIGNEILYRYAHACSQTANSDLLAASATHQRSDALSSLVVLLSAVFDTFLPYQHFDGIAAFFIGAFIVKMGIKIACKGVFELLDGGIEQSRYQELVKYMIKIPGVCGVHSFRTRKQAGDIYLDAHIMTDPFISVSEGHFIGEKLRRRVMRKFQDIVDVVVHIDAEDDTYLHDMDSKLPERSDIEKIIDGMAQENPIGRHSLIIHYLKERLYIDFVLEEPVSKRVMKKFLDQLQQTFVTRNVDVHLRAFNKVVELPFC